MGNIAGSPPVFGGVWPRYEVLLHAQSKFDQWRGKDALAMVTDRRDNVAVKEWLLLDEAMALCKLLNESEKI